jgi:hypothetical protein
MKIKYADGTFRTTADNADTIAQCLNTDLGRGWIHYAGLVWADEEDAENDDGANAVAEIIHDSGERATDILA